jgi:hypothetical protein
MYIFNINIRTFIARRLRKLRIFNYFFPQKPGANGKYYYSIWMSHLIKLNSNGNSFFPKSVAELGPGHVLGAGLAALLSGVSHYFALDIQNYYDKKRNVDILEELLLLFKSKENISKNCKFPSHIISDEMLANSLAAERIELIRYELKHPHPKNKMIVYFAPWTDSSLIRKNSVDLILSQCVLEHVDELEQCYHAMNIWLKKGAFMSHLIDFKSHEFTRTWNGHWTLSEKKWNFVRGSKNWAINRIPSSYTFKLC